MYFLLYIQMAIPTVYLYSGDTAVFVKAMNGTPNLELGGKIWLADSGKSGYRTPPHPCTRLDK